MALREFIRCLQVDEIRLTRPTPFVFLCGGEIKREEHPISAREALLRRAGGDSPTISGAVIRLAEELNERFARDVPFDDLLDFESLVASCAETVVLISESAGSFAELGAFVETQEIADRLIIVLRAEYRDASSFIAQGPVRKHAARYSERVISFPWSEEAVLGGVVLDPGSFARCVDDLLSSISDVMRSRTQFEKLNSSRLHAVILCCVVVQLYGLARESEIQEALSLFGWSGNLSEFRKILFCAVFVGWLKPHHYGNLKYFYNGCDEDFVRFRYRATADDTDTARWSHKVRSEALADQRRGKAYRNLWPEMMGHGE